MHITITGQLGSGKSTAAKTIVERYGFNYFSTGQIMRAMAEEAGMDICQFNIMIKGDPTVDLEIDNRTREVARAAETDTIFDSRMAWFFAPVSFKVFVTVDRDVAVARVAQNPRPGEPQEPEALYCELKERADVERARFVDFYGAEADYYDLSHYNLVIDSTHRTREEVVEGIWAAYQAYCADPETHAHIELL